MRCREFWREQEKGSRTRAGDSQRNVRVGLVLRPSANYLAACHAVACGNCQQARVALEYAAAITSCLTGLHQS